MKTGLIVLNFGEPEEPTLEAVVPFLERIFYSNADLEGETTEAEARARSHRLAVARAPGLMDEYEEIGGSPLNAQARRQGELLEAELRRRGLDATCFLGMQFTEPTIADALAAARDAGMERLVCLPVYPLCGRSTTIAALADVRREAAALPWNVEILEITGWHNHPDYARLHADNIRSTARDRGVDLHAPGTRLVFSAHGTPVKYLDEGNRYDRYVDEICSSLARELDVASFTLGFQNHGNRPIEWTQPDIDTAVDRLDGDDAVVVAVSFMHEQSETLAELDHDLREAVEARGLAFHRVPVPFEDERFIAVLADLVLARLEGAGADVHGRELKPCLCRSDTGACCLNGRA